MKRQELKNLLHGVENSGDIIDAIMEINGADIENAKKSFGNGDETLKRENERLTSENSKLTESLKTYDKGGERYVDVAEFERLKTFEADTLAKQKTEKQTGAVKALLKKNNAKEDMIDLLLNGVALDGIELGEDGTIKDGDKLVAGLKEKYSAGFSEDAQGAGGAPFTKPEHEGGNGNGFDFGFTPIRPQKK